MKLCLAAGPTARLVALAIIPLAAAGCTDRSSPAAQSGESARDSTVEQSTLESTDNNAKIAQPANNAGSVTSAPKPNELDDTASDPVSPEAAPDSETDQLASAAASDPTALPAESERAPPANPKPRGTRDITFDTIKFEMEKEEPFVRTMLTPAIEKLNDTKIRIRGYILPSFQQTGITQFVLVRDNMECCFGPGAALYDCIVVQMSPGNTATFTTRPVAVEGVFSINELVGPDDRHLAIYHLVADEVK